MAAAISPIVAVITVCGLFYPVTVYYGVLSFSPAGPVFFGIALIVARLFATRRRHSSRAETVAAVLAVAVLLGLLARSPDLAAKAYPAAVSFTLAGLFLLSLIRPPSIIERIARVREPGLSQAGVVYTRNVTIVWTCFLLANGAISVATGIWGTLEQWTLWNGVLSYIAIGTLFAGEFLVRRRIQR